MAKMPRRTDDAQTSATERAPRTRMWTLKNSETGQFARAKKVGGPFKGVKREN